MHFNSYNFVLYVTEKYLLLQVCARIHHRLVLLYVTEKHLLLQAQENYKLRWLLYVIPKYLLLQALYVVILLALNYMLHKNICCCRCCGGLFYLHQLYITIEYLL
jgi:hypothetical protein